MSWVRDIGAAQRPFAVRGTMTAALSCYIEAAAGLKLGAHIVAKSTAVANNWPFGAAFQSMRH